MKNPNLKIYKFLFETVNETEEYYLQHHKVSGKLNPVISRELYDIYKKVIKKNLLFFYNIEGVLPNNAEESGFPLDRGALEPTSNFTRALIHVMPNEQKIFIPKEKFLFDPKVHVQLQSLQQVFPEFNEFNVLENATQEEKNLGTLNSLLASSEDVTGTFPRYVSRYERERMKAEEENPEGETFEPEFQEFKFKVLKDITKIPWYHATRRSNLNSIKKTGLIPSKDFQHVQERGWTVLNFDLQNAVYLTMNYEHAKDIAKTLASRYEETGIVLEVNGSILKNRNSVVVDEDALRNDYDGNVTIHPAKGMPNYIESVLHSVESIGFSKTIPPSYIKFKWSTRSENDDDGENNGK